MCAPISPIDAGAHMGAPLLNPAEVPVNQIHPRAFNCTDTPLRVDFEQLQENDYDEDHA